MRAGSVEEGAGHAGLAEGQQVWRRGLGEGDGCRPRHLRRQVGQAEVADTLDDVVALRMIEDASSRSSPLVHAHVDDERIDGMLRTCLRHGGRPSGGGDRGD